MKKLLINLLCSVVLFSADFVPLVDNPSWNYLFSSYSDKSINGAGIKDENIATPEFTISSDILDVFLYALPENTNAATAHPEYFPQTEPEIIINETAEAFVTFYSEGAGYRNTLGYYTYEGDTRRNIPASIDDLRNEGVIIFPNTSFLYSGGKMSYGQSVSLGELAEGTKVIFFIVSNGWMGNGIRQTDWIFSSYSALNLEYDANSNKEVPNHKHVALLWSNVGPGNILLMGFEDILRTHNGCDHDYNDVLFSFSTNPMRALSSVNGEFQAAPAQTDSDNDGVNDSFDDYKDDPERAYISQYPSANDNITLLFEDMWPAQGDYDMNDLSLELHINEIQNSSNLVKEIQFQSLIKTSGAAYKNGFAIQVDTPYENIEDINMTVNSISQEAVFYSDDQGGTIIKFFEDAVQEFKKRDDFLEFSQNDYSSTNCNDPYSRFINVCKNRIKVSSPEINITVILKTASSLASPPYNPFMIVNNGVRSYNEVHLPNYQPTSFAPNDLFNTRNDATNLHEGVTYKTKEGKPWALLIPTSFSHPSEKNSISGVYQYYNEWVNSNGANYSNWYLHNEVDTQNTKFADHDKIILP